MTHLSTAAGRRGEGGALRQSRAAEGYQHVPFAYAPPVEQDRQAERRLQGDAFRPELLGQPPQAVQPVEPAQRDRGQAAKRELTAQPPHGSRGPGFGDGSAAATRNSESPRAGGDRWQLNGQAGADGASGGAASPEAGEDGRGGRRQKKKARHRERRRVARERDKRDRHPGRRHPSDGEQPSDTDAVVSGWLSSVTGTASIVSHV